MIDSTLSQIQHRLAHRQSRWDSIEKYELVHSLANQEVRKFSSYLRGNSILGAILADLETQFKDREQEWDSLLGTKEAIPQGSGPSTDEEDAARAWYYLRYCAESATNWSRLQLYCTTTSPAKESGPMARFYCQWLITPLIDYLVASLELGLLYSGLLIRYKNRIEWFEKEPLLRRIDEEKKMNTNYSQIERALQMDVYRYFHDCGVEIAVEPKSPDGRIDLVANQIGHHKLLVEVKVFSGSKSVIKKGITQTRSYLDYHNYPLGYLVVFNVSKSWLDVQTASSVSGCSTVNHGGKAIRILVINLHTHVTASGKIASASTLPKIKTVTILETELLSE